MDQKIPENKTKTADDIVGQHPDPPVEDQISQTPPQTPQEPLVKDVYIKFFNEVGKDDIGMVGGKIASLGEMTQNLQRLDLKVPYGFAVAVDAYSLILECNTIEIDGRRTRRGPIPGLIISLHRVGIGEP